MPELKIDLSNKKAIAGAIVLICAIALIVYLPNILSLTNPDVCYINGVCQHEQRVELLTQMVPVFILSGVIIGALVFFFMTSKLEDRRKDLAKTTQTLIKFLNKDEKLAVQKIIENNGKVLQAEISRIPGLGKVKSHRIIQRLVDRGVIEVEGYGKTNIVRFTKEIKGGLF